MDKNFLEVTNKYNITNAQAEASDLLIYKKDADALKELVKNKNFRWLLFRLGEWNFIREPAKGSYDEGRRACVLDVYSKIRQVDLETEKLFAQSELEYLETIEAFIKEAKIKNQKGDSNEERLFQSTNVRRG